LQGNVSRRFVTQADYFHQVSYRVFFSGQCCEERQFFAIHWKSPRTNEVHGTILPRHCGSFPPSGRLTMPTTQVLELLTRITPFHHGVLTHFLQLRVKTMHPEGVCQSGYSHMPKGQVIPTNNIRYFFSTLFNVLRLFCDNA
jgi:hypothetical protein